MRLYHGMEITKASIIMLEKQREHRVFTQCVEGYSGDVYIRFDQSANKANVVNFKIGRRNNPKHFKDIATEINGGSSAFEARALNGNIHYREP